MMPLRQEGSGSSAQAESHELEHRENRPITATRSACCKAIRPMRAAIRHAEEQRERGLPNSYGVTVITTGPTLPACAKPV